MSELRQNRITGEWVIIATERAKRPEDFHKHQEKPPLPKFNNDCPFCPGNEHMTPPEIMADRRLGTRPNTKGWRVRVFANKFPALTPDEKADWFHEAHFFNAVKGFGVHDVIVDNPAHDKTIGTMTKNDVEHTFFTYRERYQQLEQEPHILLITIFRNYGARAGASLEHPHSQLIATPVIPTRIQMRLDVARDYFNIHSKCITCDMIESTLEVEERVIYNTDNFVVFEPFASQAPFETWIVPKRHCPSFGEITKNELKELSHLARDIMRKIYYGVGDPDYNYLIQSSPVNTHFREHYHWYFQIVPRLNVTVGFELCSGIYISTAKPEETAEFLRTIKVPV
ncbi:MAG: galactose-1-phosphate uridylyltransferase [bacterium]